MYPIALLSVHYILASNFYHTSNSRKRMGVNREVLQLHAAYKKQSIFYHKSHKNSYLVLQITCTASEYAMKSKVCMIKIITTIVPSYTEKYHLFVAVGIVTHAVHS